MTSRMAYTFILGTVFSALWASAFVAGKVALDHCEPISLLCVRFAAAGVAMILWITASKGLRAFAGRDLLIKAALLGALNNALYLGLSFKGLETLSPEATVLIVSTAPFFTIAISAALGGGSSSIAHVIGAIIGFAGVYVVLSARMGVANDSSGVVLVFLGTISFAIGTVVYRNNATHHDPVVINSAQNIAGALMLLPFAKDVGEPVRALSEPTFFLAFMHLVVAVSVVDFLLWLSLIRRAGASHAATFHLLNPIFGIMLSAAALGTPILHSDVIGTIIVVAGLAAVSSNMALPRTSRSPLGTAAASDKCDQKG